MKEMELRPALFLMVGLPGTGKTTAARRIEVEEQALRLTKDELMKALYGPENPSSASDVIEGRFIEIGLRALSLGLNVVLDFGLWSKDERSALRQAAADLGARAVIRYFDLTSAEQRKRLDQRQADEPHTTWPLSDEEIAGWAHIFSAPTPGELDGNEPIDPRRQASGPGLHGAGIAGPRRFPDIRRHPLLKRATRGGPSYLVTRYRRWRAPRPSSCLTSSSSVRSCSANSRRPPPSKTGTRWISSSSSRPCASKACAAPAPCTSTARSPAAATASATQAAMSV